MSSYKNASFSSYESKRESRYLDVDNGYHKNVQETLNEKEAAYIRDMMTEKNRMNKNYPIAEKLLEIEIDKVGLNGRVPAKEYFANIYREKPMRVAQKVLIPVREHPKFNFVGKLLGPKGNSLRRLQEDTLCKIIILGRNSIRDHAKEEELKSCDDPRFNHLTKDLHVEISTVAPPLEAYGRIAYALEEVRKYLIPDSNDEIRQKQYKELQVSSSSKSSSVPSYNRSPTHASSSYMKVAKPKVMSNVRVVYEDPYRHSYDYDVHDYSSYGSYEYPYVKSRPVYERPEYEEDYGRVYGSHSPTYATSTRKTYYPTSPGAQRSRGDSVRYTVAPYPSLRK